MTSIPKRDVNNRFYRTKEGADLIDLISMVKGVDQEAAANMARLMIVRSEPVSAKERVVRFAKKWGVSKVIAASMVLDVVRALSEDENNDPPAAVAQASPRFLVVAMDDDGNGNPHYCADEAAVEDVVTNLMFSDPGDYEKETGKLHAADLIEEGFINFEGDPGIHLYRLPVDIAKGEPPRGRS